MVDYSYEKYTDNLLNRVFSNIPTTAVKTESDDERENILQKIQLQQESLEKKLSELLVANNSNNHAHSKIQRVPVKSRPTEQEDEDEAHHQKRGKTKDESAASQAVLEKAQAEQAEINELQKRKSLFSRRKKSIKSPSPDDSTSSSSFWKPREQRPKGWWKGNTNRNDIHQQQQPQQSAVNTAVANTTANKSMKPSTSIKKRSVAKPKRPMAFKSPQQRQKKNRSIKKKQQQPTSYYANHANNGGDGATRHYALPFTSPVCYPQASTMMPSQQPLQQYPYMMPITTPSPNYYMMPPNMLMGQTSPRHYQSSTFTQQQQQQHNNKNTTIYNPRESSNDRCLIM
ncbi:hypothetical protein BDF20DRAFT_909007 [Mycotypha africana]|uniref:uncharacterized protein n=1 Tax=Mycotypha africana TaxID=64632 RepID=UPI0023006B4F|nr:uncharacterized protein BDF20DRAFT_909007 [Mycotypha africana]KAI8991191.1 hypothetical protein BDF20DRAFT_909007 [Mycotypha africana]